MDSAAKRVKLKPIANYRRGIRNAGYTVALGLLLSCEGVGHSATDVRLVGICAQPWQAADSWIPASQRDTVVGAKALLVMGGWWNEASYRSAPPQDSNGIFVDAIETTFPLNDAPVQVQILAQPAAAEGPHEVIPSPVGSTGDGFFLLMEAEGVASEALVRDSGRARRSHPFYGSGDPNTIQTITVTTDGTAAIAGDLAVAIFVMDNNYNPDIKTKLPSGWTLIGRNDQATDNIGYVACYQVVTTPGAQSVTFNWTDDSTFVAEAAIAILRAESTKTNTPPVLPVIADRTINAMEPLTFTVTASDADIPAQNLSYALVGAPFGASIDAATGLFAWTPSSDQGPGTNTITIVVTDDGSPNMSATESFRVIVNAPTAHLKLNLPTSVSVDELTVLDVLATVTTGIEPLGQLTFGLDSGPDGITIDADAGRISWVPTEAQGPGTYTVSVLVKFDFLFTSIAATNSFVVQVNEVNSKPLLSGPTNETIHAGMTYTNFARAIDPDIPANSHVFSLISGPPGLTLQPDGKIEWLTRNVAAGDYPVTLQVTDDGVPSLKDTQSFTITVTSLPSLSIEITAGQNILTWMALAGRVYRVEYKDDLNATEWSDSLGDVTAQDENGRVVDASPPSIGNRFYRVLIP